MIWTVSGAQVTGKTNFPPLGNVKSQTEEENG